MNVCKNFLNCRFLDSPQGDYGTQALGWGPEICIPSRDLRRWFAWRGSSDHTLSWIGLRRFYISLSQILCPLLAVHSYAGRPQVSGRGSYGRSRNDGGLSPKGTSSPDFRYLSMWLHAWDPVVPWAWPVSQDPSVALGVGEAPAGKLHAHGQTQGTHFPTVSPVRVKVIWGQSL